MRNFDAMLLDLAKRQRLLTKKQAGMIMEMLATGVGPDAASLMLDNHFVTQEQLSGLVHETEEAIASGIAAPSDTQRLDSPPAGAPPEDRPPTAGDLRKAQAQHGHHGHGHGHHAPAQQHHAPAQQHHAPAQQHHAPAQKQAAPAAAPAPAPKPAPPPPPPVAQPVFVATDPAEVRKALARLLHTARHWGASDLHLTVGRPPLVRLGGVLRPMDEAPLTPEQSELLAFAALRPEQVEEARGQMQLDFALEIPRLGRHRCNVFKERLGWDAAFRIVPSAIPTFEQLGLPESLKQLTEYHQGLVMITGSGGSGKTTTAAAMLDLVNAARQDHIITVEDPVEYVLTPKNCQVMQREVGRHTQSFANALRAALREDPDIIFIGELRDLETTSISISAAETGHLVFVTMNTSSAARTVAKVVDFYPSTQQRQVLTMVAESLRGVVTQQLMPRVDGQGQALAYEILINTSGVSQQIKDGKTHMIMSLIQSGKKAGMILMEESMMNLVKAGIVTAEEAHRRAHNKQSFEPLLKRGA